MKIMLYLLNVLRSSLFMYFFSSKSLSNSYICHPVKDVLGFFCLSMSSMLSSESEVTQFLLLLVERFRGESGARMSEIKCLVKCPPFTLNYLSFTFMKLKEYKLIIPEALPGSRIPPWYSPCSPWWRYSVSTRCWRGWDLCSSTGSSNSVASTLEQIRRYRRLILLGRTPLMWTF